MRVAWVRGGLPPELRGEVRWLGGPRHPSRQRRPAVTGVEVRYIQITIPVERAYPRHLSIGRPRWWISSYSSA